MALSFREFESMSFANARGRVQAAPITQHGMGPAFDPRELEGLASAIVRGGSRRGSMRSASRGRGRPSLAAVFADRPESRGMTYEELLALDENNVKIGLTPDQFRRKIAVRRASHADGKENDPITQEPFTAGESVAEVRRCGHKFKESGLRQWLQNEHICPVCRADIRE